MKRALLALLLAATAFAADDKPKVEFTTTMGKFTLELEPKAAPKTVDNFLKYVRKGHYAGTTFHRVIATFMVQGGGMDVKGAKKPTDKPVENEADLSTAAGLLNTRGTVAMARTGDPHSASAQFFVNVVDNAFLNYREKSQQGWGYTVFGKVVEGMETIDKIKDVKVEPGENKPLENVVIQSATVLGDPAKPAKTTKSTKPAKTEKATKKAK